MKEARRSSETHKPNLIWVRCENNLSWNDHEKSVPVLLCACDCVACAAHPQAHAWNECRMSSTFVTLAEVLEARGGPLQEEEVWSLLLGSAEALVDVSYKGNKLWATSFFLYVNQCNCNYYNCH